MASIAEKAIVFRHPDYNPDRAQKLISSSMSRHLSTRNITSKSMHAFLSNLANRQTDRQTRANAFTSSFVGGNKRRHSSYRTTEAKTRSIARPVCDSRATCLLLVTSVSDLSLRTIKLCSIVFGVMSRLSVINKIH